MNRSHHCCELTKEDAGISASLIGWINSIRDHGGILFIDLRDREGLTQVVIDPSDSKFTEVINDLKPESVIEVSGTVKLRSEDTVNLKLKTGSVELEAEKLSIHNSSKTPPFPVNDEKTDNVNEDLRLTYRYLDLRRPGSLNFLKKRHLSYKVVRDFMDDNKFIEIETPLLFKSTPEGAREFLVPSRFNPGKFYALSQSPQQFKQLLMVAGVERYYQIVKCFRDENLRSDRQPEFTQIDIELSFIDREDLYALVEGLLKRLWKDVLDVEIGTPFPRLSYREAMNRFGIDKPDTRFGLELVDLSDIFNDCEFKVFSSAIQSGGVVKAINAKGLADITQGELKETEDAAKSLGAKGLAFIKVENGEWKSPILKFFSEEEKSALNERLKVDDGDIIFFAATTWDRACTIMGRIRLECAQLLSKRGILKFPPGKFNFLWVTDFPLMLYDEEMGGYASAHHPFTAPVPEDVPLLDSDPLNVRGQHYDVVLNGVELGGGSIRIHQSDVQRKVFEDVLEIPADVVENRFGYLLRSFQYGAPPHGGIAIGFDRLVAILCGRESIRDVIAFPKTQKGQCLVTETPSSVNSGQLNELHIELSELVEDAVGND
ncbi:MAG: Aspartate--tRNA ligase [Candidatus Moanabacter tarae]|uniref:Aspartate--tRNA(Asp/Asn) ligase n=1 Tax=Candidatus Moanibacter tarae TaxID=2200854 RepID=A0A2Z4AHZ7_9BACT|nr:MAG: Aspartate--tRNA ligase [Candidatus Moanabacter tarae]|tara:strand:- start:14310 stop:16115 length:1806 start_codon:yes stop_codon:yes gene_type:complete